ncbi:unnamed protein product, partial [Iphiclides podalirius]
MIVSAILKVYALKKTVSLSSPAETADQVRRCYRIHFTPVFCEVVILSRTDLPICATAEAVAWPYHS